VDDWKGAPLRQILWAEFIPDGQSERITFEGPQVDLPPKHALALTLTLHELATNAAKYGALSKNGGTLMVKWSVKMDGAERELSFEWNENLDEPLPSRRVTESFGMKLIKNAITHDLRGTCGHTLATGGVTCKLTFPF
jgi:two-component sensor histidine kinase